MRTRTWCVAAALACLPTLAAAQTVLSEADALAKLSADSPQRRRCGASGSAPCRPMAQPTVYVQS